MRFVSFASVLLVLCALGCARRQDLGETEGDENDGGAGGGDRDDGDDEDVVVSGGAGDGSRHDSGTSGLEYGSFEAFATETRALAVVETVQRHASVAVTSAPGNLGCAIVGDESASPGTAASLVLAKVDYDGVGDARCPEGVHSIRDEPEQCSDLLLGQHLREGCAAYKRWDASGQQTANLLAIGGFIAITSRSVSEMATICEVEFSASFDGGHGVLERFSFEFNPYAPDSTFCTQGEP